MWGKETICFLDLTAAHPWEGCLCWLLKSTCSSSSSSGKQCYSFDGIKTPAEPFFSLEEEENCLGAKLKMV